MPSTYRATLSPFCPSNLANWFAIAEGQLYLDNNTDKRRKYFMVLFAYPESTGQWASLPNNGGGIPDARYMQQKA
jgi:hypothetical protein